MVKLSDEPLYKEAAIPVGLAVKLGKGVGKLFASAGDNVVGMLKGWWSKGIPDVAKIMEIKPLREIPDAIHHAKLLDNKLSKEIMNEMGGAYKGILDNMKGLGSELKAVSNKVDMSRRQLNVLSDKLRDPSRTYSGLRETVGKQTEYLESLVQREADLTERLKILQNFDTVIKTNPQSVASQLDTLPQIGSEFPSLGRWKEVAEQQISRKGQIIAATSKNLGSDRRFLKEYLNRIVPLEKENTIKVMWLANPKNQIKLTQLKMKPKYMKRILGVGDEVPRSDISGLNASSLAKKLGIGAVTAGTLGGAVAIFSWANSGGEKIDQKAEGLSSLLMSARSSGLGEVILDDVKVSVNKINTVSDAMKSNLHSTPRETLSKYFEVVVTEKEKIDKNLKQWSAVVVKSDNPEEMKKIGLALQSFSAEVEGELKKVSKILETAGAIGVTPKTIDLPVGSSNMVELQRYLASLNPNITATGQLDEQTIRTLQFLEGRYNTLAETDRFTGLFYNSGTGKAIDVRDLKNLKKLEKV